MKKKKEYVLEKKDLDILTDMTNRSIRQTLFLFQLCNGDLKKLWKLEINIKAGFIFYCPGDKKEVNKLLKPIEVELPGTGHRGIINNYMTGNKKFSNQVGVYWYGGREGKEHGERIMKSGIPPYWVDHKEIKFISKP